MRPLLRTAALSLLVSAAAPASISAQIPPPPPRFVYDGAHVLSAQQRAALEDRVLQIDRETGVQIAVATFPSLDGDTPEDATMRIAEAWKPGHQGKDDGIVLAAYMAERKIRAEVGYGLEDKVPDAVASRIIREQIAPYFRQGDVAGGLMAGVDALSAAAAGRVLPRPAASPVPSSAGEARARSPLFGCFCMMFFLAMFLSSLFRARRPRHFRRGYYTTGMPWWAWFFLGSTMNQRRPGGFGSHGGGWGGGGFGGGGGGGGGGGFGGGSFGGGGSTGGW